MKYFFDRENTNKLIKESNTWVGTPWKHCVGVKQRGCDCIHFVINTFLAIGVPFKKTPKNMFYDRNVYNHNPERQVYDKIVEHFNFEEVPDDPSQWKAGDMIGIKVGLVEGHFGIIVPPYIYSANAAAGQVVKENYKADSSLIKKVGFVVRVLKGDNNG